MDTPKMSNTKIILLSIAILGGCLISSDIVIFASLAIFAFCLFRKKGRRFIGSLGFRNQENWLKTIGIAVAGVIGILLIELALSQVLPSGITSQENAFSDAAGNLSVYIPLLVAGIVIGGFVEEMLFRGFLLTRLPQVFGESKFTLFAIILVSSLIFGFAHLVQNVFSMISTTIFSVIMGIVFVRSKFNLWIVVLIHALANVVSTTLLYLGFQ